MFASEGRGNNVDLQDEECTSSVKEQQADKFVTEYGEYAGAPAPSTSARYLCASGTMRNVLTMQTIPMVTYNTSLCLVSLLCTDKNNASR